MTKKYIATIFAILAAALYAINVPLSKVLLAHVEPTMMASFLYLGAGVGLFIYGLVEKTLSTNKRKESLTRKELPYTIAMVVLDIAAPILGGAFSILFLNDRPGVQFYIAFIIMMISTYIMVKDTEEC